MSDVFFSPSHTKPNCELPGSVNSPLLCTCCLLRSSYSQFPREGCPCCGCTLLTYEIKRMGPWPISTAWSRNTQLRPQTLGPHPADCGRSPWTAGRICQADPVTVFQLDLPWCCRQPGVSSRSLSSAPRPGSPWAAMRTAALTRFPRSQRRCSEDSSRLLGSKIPQMHRSP